MRTRLIEDVTKPRPSSEQHAWASSAPPPGAQTVRLHELGLGRRRRFIGTVNVSSDGIEMFFLKKKCEEEKEKAFGWAFNQTVWRDLASPCQTSWQVCASVATRRADHMA